MFANWGQLLDDIQRGRISAEYTAGCAVFQREYRPRRERAAYLRSIHTGKSSVDGLVQMIWPSLALTSCWADGPSTWYAHQLQKDLDAIEIQGKGLLATEAFVSVPRVAQPAPALAVRSHFFEFQPVTTAGASADVILANELEAGRDYRVIVTTAGGLYRYRMHDQVTVIGFERQAPLLRFVGKADSTSDLVGEKVNDAHVRHVLQSIFEKYNIQPSFAVLRAERDPVPHYTLYLTEPTLIDNSIMIDALCTDIDMSLSNNPCYQYARQATQLGRIRLKLADEQRASALLREYAADCIAAGQRLGDVKPLSLVSSR
jgi:GH3 auxin-responsive promoter